MHGRLDHAQLVAAIKALASKTPGQHATVANQAFDGVRELDLATLARPGGGQQVKIRPGST